MNDKSIIYQKAYSFALDVIRLYEQLQKERKEFVLSKQFLRAGTSIGANINEAISAESKKDFVHKLSIALKEARETFYWLNLLKDANYISTGQFNATSEYCKALTKILSSIIITTKERYLKTPNS